MTAAHEGCEVAVVGLGPVGAALAGLLGARGVDVLAIDPADAPYPHPRAIAADDEMLRTVLRLPGLADPQRLFQAGGRVEVRTARGALLTALAFGEGVLGVPGLSFFHQPSLERELRGALDRLPAVRRHLGASVTGVSDVAGGVRLALDDGAAVTAQWVVGCDGAASRVRRERGIEYAGRTFAEPWVVVDVDCPKPLPHLPNFTYLLDPQRPAVNMPRPGGHRFEFMLRRGEDPAAMAAPEQISRWLQPYLAALADSDRSQLEIVRAAVYTFHTRIAARWRDGRVLLAGDAAHCMPPFGGQGLAAGIGDALALAWRLDEVRRGVSPPRSLDGYERERRARVAEMSRTARVAGRLLTATSAPRAAATRVALRAVNASPVAGPWFRAGGLRKLPQLAAPRSERHGGKPLPNPRVRAGGGAAGRLDDVIPLGWSLLGHGTDPWAQVGGRLAEALRVRGCSGFVVAGTGSAADAEHAGCPVIEDLDGTLLGLWQGCPQAVALVRPDRFLAAVDRAPHVEAAFRRLAGLAPPDLPRLAD